MGKKIWGVSGTRGNAALGPAPVICAVICCLAGVAVATLAYGEHYNTNPSPCQINSVWDCGIVNHSPYALVHGIPVALIGVLGYALLIALIGRFPWIAFCGALVGVAFSLHYTFLEWRVLQVWCLYCVTSQCIIVLVALLTLMAALHPRPIRGRR